MALSASWLKREVFGIRSIVSTVLFLFLGVPLVAGGKPPGPLECYRCFVTRLPAFRYELKVTGNQGRALALRQEVYELCGQSVNCYDLSAELPDLKAEAPAQSLQQSLSGRPCRASLWRGAVASPDEARTRLCRWLPFQGAPSQGIPSQGILGACSAGCQQCVATLVPIACFGW